jgi:hypothetical protein
LHKLETFAKCLETLSYLDFVLCSMNQPLEPILRS